MADDRLPVRAMRCYTEGRQSKRRRRKRWTDGIKEDLIDMNMNARQAMDWTECDRQTCRQILTSFLVVNHWLTEKDPADSLWIIVWHSQ